MGYHEYATLTLEAIRDTLYADGPDTEWDADTIEEIADMVDAYLQIRDRLELTEILGNRT